MGGVNMVLINFSSFSEAIYLRNFYASVCLIISLLKNKQLGPNILEFFFVSFFKIYLIPLFQ